MISKIRENGWLDIQCFDEKQEVCNCLLNLKEIVCFRDDIDGECSAVLKNGAVIDLVSSLNDITNFLGELYE